MTTPLVFIDTETTSLRPDRRAWEIGLIRRELPEAGDLPHLDTMSHWFVWKGDLDLGNADPFSLKIGGFYNRHPDMRIDPDGSLASQRMPERDVMAEVEEQTRGAHLVGNVVSFDAEVLANRMRAHGICPSWHYHLIDIESKAAGYLAGRAALAQELSGSAPLPKIHLPWDSEWLSRAVGVEPPTEEDRHTALGDARWAMRMYDAIIGGAS